MFLEMYKLCSSVMPRSNEIDKERKDERMDIYSYEEDFLLH